MSNFLTGGAKISRVGVGQGRDPSSDASPSGFNPQDFINLINTYGMPVLWEKAMLCPSRINSPSPATHDPNCKLCKGDGYLYIDPQPTKMSLQGATLEQTFFIQGRFDAGVTTITSFPTDRISYWDKVTMTTSQIRYTDLVTRHKNSLIDPLRYPMLDVLHIQDSKKGYDIGRDFRLVDNQIVWTKNDSARPRDGVAYSIMCVRRPVYIILNLINQHNDVPDLVAGTTNAMPLQATAKLDFLVRDESLDAAAVAPASPFGGER